MPLSFGLNIVEGKVHKQKKKTEEDGEKAALRELQTLLSSKNRKPCDCEAQVHDLLENCLRCGRLTCIVEGAGKCFTCGSLVLSQEQRERLNKYIDVKQPMTSAGPSTSSGPSTKIIDNQFDHFTIDNSKHLREEDRRRLREHLEELQSQRYRRKLVLEVDIDNLEAGSRSMPQIDDYEAALKDLQLNQQSTIGLESTHLLSELVAKEFKCNYGYDYLEPRDPPKENAPKPSPKTEPSSSQRPQAAPKKPYASEYGKVSMPRARQDRKPTTLKQPNKPSGGGGHSRGGGGAGGGRSRGGGGGSRGGGGGGRRK